MQPRLPADGLVRERLRELARGGPRLPFARQDQAEPEPRRAVARFCRKDGVERRLRLVETGALEQDQPQERAGENMIGIPLQESSEGLFRLGGPGGVDQRYAPPQHVLRLLRRRGPGQE